MKCKKGFEVKVCQSGAGYYLGTMDKEGLPNCRISDYAETEKEAEKLPMVRQFKCVENEFCNGGTGCFDK